MSWNPQQGYGQPSGAQPYGQPQQHQQTAYGGQNQYGAPMQAPQTGMHQPHQGAISLGACASRSIIAFRTCVHDMMGIPPMSSVEL